MNENAALIDRFYKAFQAKDGDAMAACYADDVEFSDPVFVGLRGERARNMWRMLCKRAKDLTLEYSVGDDSAHWEAKYTFATTGRKVLNIIDAKFVIKDGKIAKHTDTFSFWRWSRQALGPAGLLLGWSPMLQNKVRATALKGLDAFEKR